MVRHHISDELKETALSMSLQGICDSDIREYTGISERSLKRLWKTHRESGAVSRKATTLGRHRVLTSMDVRVCCIYAYAGRIVSFMPTQFLCDCVKRQPDMTLAELQTELREACNVETSVQTITWSLQREGFTMKMVRSLPFPTRLLYELSS